MKKLVISGIIVACIAFSYLYPHTMLSPGELAAAHHELNNQCLSCHQPLSGISNKKCISCHKLADIGRDTNYLEDTSTMQQKLLFHEQLASQSCTACHTDHQGIKPASPLSFFDHSALPVSTITNCAGCHYKPTDSLHSYLPNNCNSCHNTQSWKSSFAFDHELISITARTNCTTCHQNPPDEFHQGLTTGCNQCHGMAKWVPSTFDHSAYFQLDKDHNVKCNTCHTDKNYKIYTCYGCHEHGETEIISKHNEEGIYQVSNCASCHKNSDEHDIRMPGKGSNKEEIKELQNYIKSRKGEGKHEKEED